MTGKQIKDLCNQKFDPSSRFIDSETGESSFDSENYGPYPYACLVKDNIELEDNTEYLVSIAEKMLTAEQYQSFADSGKILNMETLSYIDGISLFGEKFDTVSKSNIEL